MKFRTKLGLFFGIALVSLATFASDLAVLTNGYTIRHERREVVGATTRLYLGSDASSYVDIPTSEIQSFENDLTPVSIPAAAPTTVPKKSQHVPIAVQQKLHPWPKPQQLT